MGNEKILHGVTFSTTILPAKGMSLRFYCYLCLNLIVFAYYVLKSALPMPIARRVSRAERKSGAPLWFLWSSLECARNSRTKGRHYLGLPPWASLFVTQKYDFNNCSSFNTNFFAFVIRMFEQWALVSRALCSKSSSSLLHRNKKCADLERAAVSPSARFCTDATGWARAQSTTVTLALPPPRSHNLAFIVSKLKC